MNLYFRLLWMFLAARFKSRVSVLDPFETRHRVLPNDLDLLGHMNNGRYSTITDLSRMELLIRAGVWKEMKKHKIHPVSAGQTIQFRKPLMPFQKYSIITRTIGWDKRFIYVEHKFQSGETVYALMLMKVMVIGQGSHRMTPEEIFHLVEQSEIDEINIDEIIEKWNESSHRHWIEKAG